MAKKTLIIDDLTGETGARTHALRFDGTDYEIDLTDASFAELRALLKPYLRAARQVGGDVVAGSRRGRPSTDAGVRRRPGSRPAPDSSAIRAWARSVDVPVTERGRVPALVRAAWQAAGSPR